MLMLSKKATDLIVPGRIIGSTDGQPWLVLSSVLTSNGHKFRLADLGGTLVPTPPDFQPISFQAARFAAMLRRAFNPDIDQYVKEYIRAAGLPVDQGMNWAKYLYKIMSPTRLGAPSGPAGEEYADETIGQYIIPLVMGHRGILDSSNEHGFQQKIKSFPPEVQEMPLDKQVSLFLQKSFKYRIGEARRYCRETLQGQDVSEDVTGESFVSTTPEDEGEGGMSPLETQEHATGTRSFQEVEEGIELRGLPDTVEELRDRQVRHSPFLLDTQEIPASRGPAVHAAPFPSTSGAHVIRRD